MSVPKETELSAGLDELSEQLRRLRVDRGNPTLERIASRASAIPGTRSLSVSALSEVLNGKYLPGLDSWMSLVRTLLSYDGEGRPCRVGRGAPELEIWRTRWQHAKQEQRRTRRPVLRAEAEGPHPLLSPMALRALANDLGCGYVVPLAPFEGPADGFDAVAFSPDGRYLALGGTDGAVYLQDPATGNAKAGPLVGHRDIVRGLAFSADGRLLASSADDSTVWLWDVTFRSPVGGSLPDCEGIPQSVAFSPDGRLLAAGGLAGHVHVWDTATREIVKTLNARPTELGGVAFSPDGALLAASGQNGPLRLWASATWDAVGESAVGKCCDVAFSPDGTLLATAGADGLVRFWNPHTPGATRPVRTLLPASKYAVSAVVFSPDGRLLAAAGMDGTVRVWDTMNGLLLASPPDALCAELYSVSFSPDGGLLAAVGEGCTVHLCITPGSPSDRGGLGSYKQNGSA
ncbi:WD40 repeat domain-containing protein [Streptomyces violascens]|uniref:WD40 repeat domain-containing protein n=1 Tax=Streptomyces violascens TaxID=67381 RepID=UPI00364609F8